MDILLIKHFSLPIHKSYKIILVEPSSTTSIQNIPAKLLYLPKINK